MPADEPWNKQYRHCPYCNHANEMTEDVPSPEVCQQCGRGLFITNATERVTLWDAVNEYAAACGGDTSDATISDQRMNAVAAVERAIEARVMRDALPTTIERERAKWLAEDITWLKAMRAEYANLVESIGTDEDGDMDRYVSSWDQSAHDECLMRTERAINELEKMYPYDPSN